MPDFRPLRLHTTAALAAGASVRVVAALAALAMFAGLLALAANVRGYALIVALFTWPLIAVAWRAAFARAGLPEEPAGAPPEDDRLARLVAEEAEALGAAAPDALLVTAGRDVTLHRGAGGRVLAIGLATLAERGAAGLRIAIAEALAHDADVPGRRLCELREGPVARALAIAEDHRYTSLPWVWHAALAHRLLCAAIRRRTLAVDAALAARHGADAATAHVRAWAWEPHFEAYWNSFVLPCLRDGFRPPIAEGWRRVLASPDALEEFAELVDGTPEERLAAVRDPGPGTRAPAGGPSTLPEAGDALEARVLAAGGPDALVPVDWERVADAVLLPRVRAEATGRVWLAGATIADLADLAGAEPGASRTEDLDAALLAALDGAGWAVTVDPAGGVRATSGGSGVEPFGLAASLAGADPLAWREFAAAEGVAELPLLPPDDARRGDDLEALAAAPPDASLELVLRGSRRLRARALAVVLPAIGLALPLALVSIATSLSAMDDPTIRWVSLGIGAFLILGVGLWSWTRLRLAFVRGRVVIGADRLLIEQPALLKRPYELPRALLRAAVADADHGGRDPAGRAVRFPLASTPWDDPDSERAGISGWLWTAWEVTVVPVLGVEVEPPNLALVFREPVEGPAVRRERLNGPLRGEAIGGLLLTVELPEDLDRRLAELGFAPRLGPDDVTVLVEAFDGPEPLEAPTPA